MEVEGKLEVDLKNGEFIHQTIELSLFLHRSWLYCLRARKSREENL